MLGVTSAEHDRINAADASQWRLWGPYLAERAWGTVREDYSATGEAWDYFPHDHDLPHRGRTRGDEGGIDPYLRATRGLRPADSRPVPQTDRRSLRGPACR